MGNIDDLLSRKVLGVKWLYIAAIGALILAVVAYGIWQRGKIDDAPDGEPVNDGGADDKDAYPFDSSNSNGIGSVVGTTETVTGDAGTITNDEWTQRAINYIVSGNRAPALTAQKAVQKYMNAQDLSFSERQLVEFAISGIGLPPVPPELGKLPTVPGSPGIPVSKPRTPTYAPKIAAKGKDYVKASGGRLTGAARYEFQIGRDKFTHYVQTDYATASGIAVDFRHLKPGYKYAVRYRGVTASGAAGGWSPSAYVTTKKS